MPPALTQAQRDYLAANADAAKVYDYLSRYHVGSGNALLRADAVIRLELPDRTIRDLISELITKGFPIIPIENRPGGYYISNNPDDFTVAAAILKAKARTLFRRRQGTLRALNVLREQKLEVGIQTGLGLF